MIKAYSANTAKIGVDGVPLGAVTLAEEYEDYSEYPVRGFGDSCPSAILTFDRSYSVILEREVSVGDGVRLENIGEFELQIGGRIYSGCRCIQLKKIRKPDGYELEKITIRALDRQEVSANEQ